MTSNRTLRRTARLLAAPAVAVTGLVALAGAAGATTGTLTYVAGNPTCADVAPAGATWTEAKLDFDPAPGSYTSGALHITITKDAGGLNWTTDADVAAVIMKGGPNANVYAYPGTTDTSDTGLRTPVNPNGNGDTKYYGISHVTFCQGPGTPASTPEQPKTPQQAPTPTPAPAPAPAETPAAPAVTPAAPATVAAAAEVQGEVLAAADPEPATEVLGVVYERPAAAAPAQLAVTGVHTEVLSVLGIGLLAAGGIFLALAGRPARRTTGND
jgi:hypothetical protein